MVCQVCNSLCELNITLPAVWSVSRQAACWLGPALLHTGAGRGGGGGGGGGGWGEEREEEG